MPMLTCYLFSAFVWEGGGGKEKRKEYSEKHLYYSKPFCVWWNYFFFSRKCQVISFSKHTFQSFKLDSFSKSCKTHKGVPWSIFTTVNKQTKKCKSIYACVFQEKIKYIGININSMYIHI